MMPNTYTWNFPTLTAYPTYASQTTVVYVVNWVLTAADDLGHTASLYSTQAVEYDAAGPFTPYADLTLAQVQSWVTDAMGTDLVAHYQADLDLRIANQVSPVTVALPAPWSTAS